MTDWTALRDAYGRADRVPALLDSAAAPHAPDEVWAELWGRLCHQGTVTPASHAAILPLARIALQAPPLGYEPALHLVAAILVATRGPAQIRTAHVSAIARLRPLAERNLAHAGSDVEFVHGLGVLAGLEEALPWSRHLDGVATGEVEIDCPACDEHLLVVLEAETPHVCTGDMSMTSALTPAQPSTDVEERLVSLARQHDRIRVAKTLGFAFGTAPCPACAGPVDVPEALG